MAKLAMTKPSGSGAGHKMHAAGVQNGPSPPALHAWIGLLLAGLAALLAWKLAGVMLLLFSAILLAAAFSALADGIRRLAPIPNQIAVLIAAAVMLGVLGAVVALFGWRILAQYEEIVSKVRVSAHAFMVFTRGQPWGQALLERANGTKIADATDTLAPVLGSAVGAMARYLTYAAIVIACAIFLALQPTRYRNGALILIPLSHRAEVADFLTRSALILKRWLVSRLIVMIALGVLVSIGLTILGIPGALVLGLAGGLLTFIPFLGALLAAIPAVLVAFTISPLTAVLTALTFWAAHFIEGTFITPLVQDESVDLPPVLTIFSTLAFTVVFGPSGVLLASPLVLVIITAIQVFYLESHLDHPAPALTPRRRRLPAIRPGKPKGPAEK